MAHPDFQQIDRWLGNLAGRSDRQILGHLLECATCRDRALARLRSLDQPPALADLLQYRHPGVASADETCDPLTARLRRLSSQVLARAQREQRESATLFEELMALPPTSQELKVHNDSRFASPILAQRILQHSRHVGFEDPPEAERLALLGLAVVEAAEPTAYGERLLEDLRCRAWSHVGNARRQQDDLEGAEEAFRRSEIHLEGTADPLEEAGFLHLLAVLRRVQRRFDEARRMLRRAASLCRQVDDRERLAQILTSLGAEFLEACEPDQALTPLLEARDLVDPERDPRTALYVQHNLTVTLLETDRVLEAQRAHLAARPLYRRFSDPFTQVRRKWLEGTLALHTGRFQEAEQLLLEVQSAYEESGQANYATAARLDLATLYAQQERTEDLRRMVADLSPAFRSTPVRRDARAAFALLSRFAEQEQTAREVLVAAIKKTAILLKRSRHEQAV